MPLRSVYNIIYIYLFLSLSLSLSHYIYIYIYIYCFLLNEFCACGSDGTGPDRLLGPRFLIAACNPLGYHVPNLKAPLGVMLVRTLPFEHTLLAAAWRGNKSEVSRGHYIQMGTGRREQRAAPTRVKSTRDCCYGTRQRLKPLYPASPLAVSAA